MTTMSRFREHGTTTPGNWQASVLEFAANNGYGVPTQATSVPAPALRPLRQTPYATDQGSTLLCGGYLRYELFGLPADTHYTNHMAKMDPNVQAFMLTRTGADLDAIEQLAQLASHSFATPIGAPRITFQTDVYDEDEGLQLFMDIDSHGMDTEVQLKRDARMRKAIWQDARLMAAKKYVVINVY